MTSLEMYNEFLVKYNILTNYEGLALTKREVSLFLTQAQENIADQYRALGDSTEARSSILSALKDQVVYTEFTPSQYYPDSYEVTIPSNFYYKLHERVDTQITADIDCYTNPTTLLAQRVKPITEDYYNLNIGNPFKQPYPELVWRVTNWGRDAQNFVLICDDYFKVVKYTLNYYIIPTPIIVEGSTGASIRGYLATSHSDCVLSSTIHSEIVQEAIRLATVANKDQLGIQIQQIEKQLNDLRN